MVVLNTFLNIIGPKYPYLKTRAKHMHNTCKTRETHVHGNLTRTRGVEIQTRDVFFRTKSRTKYVLLRVSGMVYLKANQLFFLCGILWIWKPYRTAKFASPMALSAIMMLKVLVHNLRHGAVQLFFHEEVR